MARHADRTQDNPELHTENSRTTMSVGDAITCECNNCVDEEIKTVSARHAEAFEALKHLFVLSSKARCEADHAEVAEWTFLPHLTH